MKSLNKGCQLFKVGNLQFYDGSSICAQVVCELEINDNYSLDQGECISTVKEQIREIFDFSDRGVGYSGILAIG